MGTSGLLGRVVCVTLEEKGKAQIGNGGPLPGCGELPHSS